MFHLDRSPIPVEIGQLDNAVVDQERNAWLRLDGSTGKEPGLVFRLFWEHRVITFEVTYEECADERTGKRFLLYKFWTFGDSVFAKAPPYNFVNAEERASAMLLATKALIVFGGFYNGEAAADGDYRVLLNKKSLKKTDFNLP